MFRYSIIFILLSCTFFVNAQDDGLIKHWTFDANESDYLSAISGGGSPNVADGRKGFGVYMNGVNHHFDIREIDVKEDFTVSFWIKPLNVERTQTILLQEKTDSKTNRTDRFLQLGIQNKALFLKDEKSYLGIEPITLEDGEWYFISYSYDGFEARIIFQDKVVFKTNKVTLYNEMYQRTDRLSIGKNFNKSMRFEGILDEVKAFNLPLKKEQVNEVFEELATPIVVEELPKENPKSIKVPAEEVTTVKIEKPADEYLKNNYRNRKNNLQHQILVTSPNIEVEVWDYDEFDEDRISITLNNSEFIGNQSRDRLVQRKRKKETYKFNLVEEKANYLTFIAEDMGKYDSQNTAAIRLIVDGKPFDDIYKLILTQEENAVIRITHVAKNPDKAPIIPVAEVEMPKSTYKVVMNNDVLDPLVVNSTAVTLKLKTTNKQSLNQKIQVSLDDRSLSKPFIINNSISKELFFNVNTKQEKILLIESFQLLKTATCNVEATIIVDGKEVKTYRLRLDKNNVLLPIVYVPDANSKKPSSQRIVTVSDTNLIFQIKDNSKVDGDIVTIKQEGKVLLENYTLTGEFRNLDINLKSNTENTFLFVAESMGRSSGENTAYVMILSNGEVIHEFSLRSHNKYKPAKLVIIHKGN
jgi:hypothetical protein